MYRGCWIYTFWSSWARNTGTRHSYFCYLWNCKYARLVGMTELHGSYHTVNIFVQGSELLSGQQALSTLSDNGLCAILLLLIFSAATFILALPRTLGRLSWLGLISVASITLCGILAMAGAGASPVPERVLQATVPTNFPEAFLAITNPVSTLDHQVTQT